VQTIGSIRERVQHLLSDAGEARMLLSLMLDVMPAELTLRANEPVTDQRADAILVAATRRREGEPLAYCAGRAPFRDLVLDVDSRVLIPRPETEILVDEVLRISLAEPGGIAVDIGTGSGAIALAVATEGQFERVIATDVSPDALVVARGNALRLPAGASPVEFREGSGVDPINGVRARVLASNPPYIAYDEAPDLPRSVRDWEPSLALFADDGGMAMYELLLDRAPAFLERDGWVVLEVDARRADETARRAVATGKYTSVELVRDLTGRQRVLVARRKD
jgi:release factor glutamine methyltransferase